MMALHMLTHLPSNQIDAAQIGDKITLPEGAILEKETSSIIVMSNAKQNIGNKYESPENSTVFPKESAIVL